MKDKDISEGQKYILASDKLAMKRCSKPCAGLQRPNLRVQCRSVGTWRHKQNANTHGKYSVTARQGASPTCKMICCPSKCLRRISAAYPWVQAQALSWLKAVRFLHVAMPPVRRNLSFVALDLQGKSFLPDIACLYLSDCKRQHLRLTSVFHKTVCCSYQLSITLLWAPCSKSDANDLGNELWIQAIN